MSFSKGTSIFGLVFQPDFSTVDIDAIWDVVNKN